DAADRRARARVAVRDESIFVLPSAGAMNPMKILAFADTRFPIERANGAQTMATCHALAQRGHDVTLVVRADTSVPARDPFVFYGLQPESRLRVRTIPGTGGPRARRAHFLLGAAALISRHDAVVYTRD